MRVPFFKQENEEAAWHLMSVSRTIHNRIKTATGSARMNVQHAPTESTESRERHSYARVPGRWLLLARGIWITLVVLTLAICFASLPVYLALLQTPCTGPACEWQQLTPGQVGALKGMGLSIGAYAAIIVALTLAEVFVCLVVSTLIILRRSHDRMAIIVALMLVTLGPTMSTTALLQSPSPWQVPNECLTFLSSTLLLLVFLLFPSGQFVPPWTRWILVVFLVGQVSLFFPVAAVPLLPNNPVSRLGYLVFLVEAAILVVVQLYRYRRVSSPLQRQQTKWVVFGIAVPITVIVLLTVLYLMFPVLSSPGSLYPLANSVVGTCWPLFFPLSFGFAMLRSRLWEIDVLINRTLVYGTLTVILTGIYVGLVIGLSALLRSIISHDSGVAIVLSTVAIYFLFQPLRRRIQQVIDRRFYRRKYDAAKVVAAFSATLRQEVDLEQLREQLVAVVQETMQPTSVSLWLCQSHQEKRAGVPFLSGHKATPLLREDRAVTLSGREHTLSSSLDSESEDFYD